MQQGLSTFPVDGCYRTLNIAYYSKGLRYFDFVHLLTKNRDKEELFLDLFSYLFTVIHNGFIFRVIFHPS